MDKVEERKEGKRFVGQYEIRETLGKGGYSWVKKGFDSKAKTTVALKFMSRADKSWEKEQAAQVRTEIKSMVKVKSQYVMKLFAYNLNCKYPEKNGNTLSTILLVLEFCPGGELFDILFYTQQLDAKTARTYFVQMIEGLKACHDAGIIHRDLKPQNLLMDAKFQLKITDFGLSKLVKNADTAVMKTHYVGTRGYQAPELLKKKKKYGKACDIFSAGVVLFILLTGYPPFEQAAKNDKWYYPLTQKDPKKFWEQHKGCGVQADAKELLTRMLAYSPGERIDIKDILATKFCTGKMHTPDELFRVLKKKHRETSKRRRKDKKKMDEMANSIKKKRDIKFFEEVTKKLNAKPCPIKNYESRKTLMTKRWVVRPNYANVKSSNVISEGEQKDETNSTPSEVVESYLVVLESLGHKGLTNIELVEDNPWDLICSATAMDSTKFQIHLKINRDENGVYYFNFKRTLGNSLKFHKFWKKTELHFIHCKHFKDELDEEAEKNELAEEANKENAAVEINQDDEKQEIKMDDCVKQQE